MLLFHGGHLRGDGDFFLGELVLDLSDHGLEGRRGLCLLTLEQVDLRVVLFDLRDELLVLGLELVESLFDGLNVQLELMLDPDMLAHVSFQVLDELLVNFRRSFLSPAGVECRRDLATVNRVGLLLSAVPAAAAVYDLRFPWSRRRFLLIH